MAMCGVLEESLSAQTHTQSALLSSLMAAMTPAARPPRGSFARPRPGLPQLRLQQNKP